jgi:hypothetical protein
MKKSIFWILGILVFFFCFSCSIDPEVKKQQKEFEKSAPEYFGNGVYYFYPKSRETTGKEWSERLSFFLADTTKHLASALYLPYNGGIILFVK